MNNNYNIHSFSSIIPTKNTANDYKIIEELGHGA